MEKEKPIVIELYELWNAIKSRFKIVSPQPKSFTLRKEVIPVTVIDGSEIILVDLDDATTVLTTATAQVVHTPPVGFIDYIRAMYLNAPIPAGGAAGSHFFYLDNNTYPTMKYTYGSNVFGSALTFNFNIWSSASASQPNGQTRELGLDRIPITNAYPLRILYENATNVSQTGARVIQLLIERTYSGMEV